MSIGAAPHMSGGLVIVDGGSSGILPQARPDVFTPIISCCLMTDQCCTSGNCCTTNGGSDSQCCNWSDSCCSVNGVNNSSRGENLNLLFWEVKQAGINYPSAVISNAGCTGNGCNGSGNGDCCTVNCPPPPSTGFPQAVQVTDLNPLHGTEVGGLLVTCIETNVSHGVGGTGWTFYHEATGVLRHYYSYAGLGHDVSEGVTRYYSSGTGSGVVSNEVFINVTGSD